MKEDQLTNKMIKNTREDQECDVEHHYNYYGTRGVVDLVKTSKERDIHESRPVSQRLIEIKSNPSNGNKVIRQFKKMVKYFYKGSEWSKPKECIYELVFISSADNFRHLVDNIEMYRALEQKSDEIIVNFRHPEVDLPLRVFGSRDMISSEQFLDYSDNVGHSYLIFESNDDIRYYEDSVMLYE